MDLSKTKAKSENWEIILEAIVMYDAVKYHALAFTQSQKSLLGTLKWE